MRAARAFPSIVSSLLPSVSIVTPALNHARFLPQAIESVLRQDYPNLEYIVVDGGSSDGTLEILKSYGDRLRWISEPDTGQSNAINKGFRMARGEILAWINADDVLLAGAVRKAAGALARDPDLAMVYGEGYIIDENGTVKRRFPETTPFNLWRLVYVGDTILQQTAFMRKRAVETAGYLDETLHWGMDWDLFIRIGKRFRVQYLNEYLGCIREYDTTKTSTGGIRRFRELEQIIRRHAGARWVPAYFGYALDTWHSALERRRPSLLRTALQKLHAKAGAMVWPYMEASQGWYPGGWAGPVVHLLVPNLGRPAHLKVEGAFRQILPTGPELRLAITVDGRPLAEASVAPGPFELIEPLPASPAGGDALKVDLIASGPVQWKVYAPGRRALPTCYLLHRAQIEPAEALPEDPDGHMT